LQELLESAGVDTSLAKPISEKVGKPIEKKVKRKASEYSKKYGKAFKKVAKINSRAAHGLRTVSSVLRKKHTK